MPPKTQRSKPAPKAKPTEATPADAVILLVQRQDDGGVSVVPQTQGDVRLTEVDSLLVLGLKQWRQQASLNVE